MPAEPTAADLLSQVAAQYASLLTYSDEGEEVTVFVTGQQSWERRTVKKRFKTAFVRPDKFFFQYREVGLGPESEWRGGTIWTDGSGVHTWSTIEFPAGHGHSIEQATGGFAGVSSGTSTLTAKLLLPDIDARSPLPEPSTSRLLGEGSVEGKSCWKVEGLRFGMQSAITWIDRRDFVIRRVDHANEFNDDTHRRQMDSVREVLKNMPADDPKRSILERGLAMREGQPSRRFRMESTTIIRPAIDRVIAPATFAFTPPTRC
jgi:hypothetical protein